MKRVFQAGTKRSGRMAGAFGSRASASGHRSVWTFLFLLLFMFLSLLPVPGCGSREEAASGSRSLESRGADASALSEKADSSRVEPYEGSEAFSGATWAGTEASRAVKGEPAGKGLQKLALDDIGEDASLWLYPLGDDLLLVRADPIGWGGMMQARLTVYDPYTGTEEAEARLTLNGMSSLQVCGDTVALWQNGKLSLYDKGLCQVGEYVSAQEHTGFWLSAARDRVYCMDTDGRCLSASLKDAESAEKTGEELSFSSAFLQYYEPEIISLAAEGERLLIRGTDPKSLRRQYYVVDAQSGEILESLGQYPAGKACSGGAGEKGGWLIAFSSSAGEEHSAVSVDGSSGRSREFISADSLLPVEGAGAFLSIRQEEGESAFSCYGPDGSHLSSACFSGKVYFEGRGKTTWLRDAACFAAVYESGEESRETGILFWSPIENMSQEEEKNLELKRSPSIPEGELAPLYERAAAMGKRFGVEIQIGEWVDLTPVEYTITPLTDYRTLEDGLNILEKTMARYPEGFFQQLRYGDVRGLKIALTGGLSSEQESGYPVKADGYVTEADGYLEMALSLEDVYYLPSVFTHETAHMIDRRLTYDAVYNVMSPFSEERWNQYNPEGFSYDNAYDGDRYLRNARWGEYFLNDYSLTYPTEDRAELMKDAMSLDPVWAGAKSVRTSPLLQEKFRYYCTCIRSAFDTEGWPETTAWEEALQTPEGALPAA